MIRASFETFETSEGMVEAAVEMSVKMVGRQDRGTPASCKGGDHACVDDDHKGPL